MDLDLTYPKHPDDIRRSTVLMSLVLDYIGGNQIAFRYCIHTDNHCVFVYFHSTFCLENFANTPECAES